MTIEEVNTDVKIAIVTENFRDYSESYGDFLKILWITIWPTKVYLIYPSGTEIYLESVQTYDRFAEIVERIEGIYRDTERFFG
tara:strand:- start:277 stop:525 length:249 start_codon:yes stop_codon:yes gene_type:complete